MTTSHHLPMPSRRPQPRRGVALHGNAIALEWLLPVLLGLVSAMVGCGPDDDPPRPTIEDVELRSELTLPGLSEPVDAVQDNRGMWHIYGATPADCARVQGYLMARDRIGQMDFIRRGVNGRLAQIAGSLQPYLVDSDKIALFMNYPGLAAQILEILPAEDREVVEAFSAGITVHIDELRSGEALLPRGLDVAIAIDDLADWTALDTLAIARFQVANQSYSADGDIRFTESTEALRAAFSIDDGDPAIAARARAFLDLGGLQAPVRATADAPADAGSSASALGEPLGGGPRVQVDPRVLAAGGEFMRTLRRHFDLLLGPMPGSNAWAVHGSKTASGYPIVANDPHLSYTSPPLMWMVHLNTTRRGGNLDAQGLALAGTPTLIYGYNANVAWGVTTGSLDVTDVYLETVTEGVDSDPDTVTFNGAQVPITVRRETIPLDTGMQTPFAVEEVPHHGPIVPGSHVDGRALSVRWTGFEPTNEGSALIRLSEANDLDAALEAVAGFEVGGLSWMLASKSGDIAWSLPSTLPVRDPRAMTYEVTTGSGVAPAFVLSGTGEHEWIGTVPLSMLPLERNPDRSYTVHANNDPMGAWADGSPFNDSVYVGAEFIYGHRYARINERLAEMVEAGGVTPEDMMALQADAQSPLGRFMTPVLLEELDRAQAERALPGTHADLTAAVAELEPKMDRIAQMVERLRDWTFDTPAGVEDEPTEAEISDSVATTIFNVTHWYVANFLADELALAGVKPDGITHEYAVYRAVVDPTSMATYDSDLGDTVLWDDLGTPSVIETRGEWMLRSMASALDFIEGELGADMTGWRWGKLHTLRLNSLVPQVGTDVLSIPAGDDERYPDGFPRHGDFMTVDNSFYWLWRDEPSFRDAGIGPMQRMIVEMTPEGPRAWNAIPGGESQDPDNPHQADEIELWRRNQAPPMNFKEEDVARNGEHRLRFRP